MKPKRDQFRHFQSVIDQISIDKKSSDSKIGQLESRLSDQTKINQQLQSQINILT